MAPHDRHHAPASATRARDAALRRLAALNRITVGVAVALVLGFTALAARATPARHHSGAAVARTNAPSARVPVVSIDRALVERRARRAARRRHERQLQRDAAAADSSAGASAPSNTPAPAPQTYVAPAPPPAPAPAPVQAPPVVVSGGS